MYDKEFEKYFEVDIEHPQMELPEDIKLDEMKWAVGGVYHQEFKNGDRVYFRADSVQKNKRWKGLSVDEFGGRQKKAKNSSADEKQQGWETTPKNEIPKGLKEEVEEARKLSQRDVGMEFAEVASMAMELLSAPYLTKDFGGFYEVKDANRARIEHLEKSIMFLPYMAVVDAFQHWAYTNPEEAMEPANCDKAWSNLWKRFQTFEDLDSSEFEDVIATGWHNKLHIYHVPFYYVEYGMAQLGAIQVWGNALKNQENAVKLYRKALSMGGNATLPELFEAAGAKFEFDENMLTYAVNLVDNKIKELQS